MCACEARGARREVRPGCAADGGRVRTARQQKVAREHSDFVAVDPVRSLGTAASVSQIDHIIVQQARRMDHFRDLCQSSLVRIGQRATSSCR